ncbi:L-2-hydroxyglutarate oxidase [Rugosimonospora africana]|uniref:L-2-hydroxyglutarate oxidase n=1 Tax=Rugosimonospora africana TaxID=556532 RepID=UPI0019411CC2|nr:L-2-hydroxyglutarate oxidase [Rugosimonospora africana]
MQATRYVIVGAGIVGLAVAHRLLLDRPHATVTVVEKDARVGAHQTGHNSGVIHSGVYYRPGSLRAKLCVAGARSMVEFCRDNGVRVEVTGKLIVATDKTELPRLHALAERAVANGVPARLVDPAEATEIEPHVSCVAALHVETTGITDYGAVCDVLSGLIAERGGQVRLNTRVTSIGAGVVQTTGGDMPVDVLVNCAGLYADRIARLAGYRPEVQIVPFRGEYFTVRRDLVRGLIYPVPDPSLPFLGVHLTRMADGSLHAGPNAVLALSREGYRWGRVDVRDLAEAAGYPGLWRLARTHLGTGVAEVRRSLSRRRFAASLARLVPEVTRDDLVPAPAGVRAQAVTRSGALADDFLLLRGDRQLHVLNAPSPAATSSLEIARRIVDELPA